MANGGEVNTDVFGASHANSYGSGNGVIGNVKENQGLISGNIVAIAGKTEVNAPGATLETATKNSQSNANIASDSASDIKVSAVAVIGNVGKNNGVILANALLNGGKINSDGSDNRLFGASAISNVPAVFGVYGNIEENNGTIQAKSVLIGGTATITNAMNSPNTNVNISYTNSGNGIFGNITENIGIVSSEAFLKAGDSSVTSNAGTSNPNSNAHVFLRDGVNGVLGDAEKNEGVISGNAVLRGGDTVVISNVPNRDSFARTSITAERSANGIFGNIEKNNGLISGYVEGTSGMGSQTDAANQIVFKDYEEVKYAGNGIALNRNISNNLINNGLIKGSQSAIAATGITGIVNNYGVMAGKEIYSDGLEMD